MGADSKIQWTHHTFNPWWGCARVSPGCEHCYAEALAKRTGKAKWGVKEERRFFGDKHWAEPIKWNRAAEKARERHRVFVASMADVFEDRRDLDEQRDRLWDLINGCADLDWLLLTKRPENMHGMVPWGSGPAWPNVWLGTTVEDQKRADERMPHLINTSAAVRFLSCEPLLGPVDLDRGNGWITGVYDPGPQHHPACDGSCGACPIDAREQVQPLDWVIVGGESGPGARAFGTNWARDIVANCKAAGVAVFVKQLGADPHEYIAPSGAPDDGGDFVPLKLVDRRKGGSMDEWPEDLRVREFPVLA